MAASADWKVHYFTSAMDGSVEHRAEEKRFLDDMEGVLGTGIAFPTVPEGKARIRTIMTATHTQEELHLALEVLGRVGKKMGILG